ncbi:MAG: hypothetical protein JST16_14495 [Bdellovibrionales bacterium]|nr:hypothetical protein [Bdellovibrionales bacterium]
MLKNLCALWFGWGLATLTQAQSWPATDAFNQYQWNRRQAVDGVGPQDRGDWYEWWYYKVVEPSSGEAFYFVYGVVNPWDTTHTRSASHGFLGAGNFKDRSLLEQHFPLDEFSAHYDEPFVRLGRSGWATDNHLEGHLQNAQGEDIAWDLQIKRAWDYNAMGWGIFAPGASNIYWYPAQADARMSGTIRYKGRTVVLRDAPAYQDRNWGRSMPEWWTWIVSNDFMGSPGTALAMGGGRPKVLDRASIKDAFGIGFKFAGHVYNFQTTSADSIQTDIRFGKWEVTATKRSGLERIEISAYAPPEKFMRLPFTSPTGEVFSDYEALLGRVHVKLYSRDWHGQWQTLADLTSESAGIEYGSYKIQGLE